MIKENFQVQIGIPEKRAIVKRTINRIVILKGPEKYTMFTVVQKKRRPSSLFDAMTDTVSKEHSHIRILILILRDMCRSKLILKQKWKVQGVPRYG